MMRDIRTFGSIKEVIELPNLTDIQIKSYDKFLQHGTGGVSAPESRLQSAFKEVFPIDEPNGAVRRGWSSTF